MGFVISMDMPLQYPGPITACLDLSLAWREEAACPITDDIRNLVIIQNLDLGLWHQKVTVTPWDPFILHGQFDVLIHWNVRFTYFYLTPPYILFLLLTASNVDKTVGTGPERKSLQIPSESYPRATAFVWRSRLTVKDNLMFMNLSLTLPNTRSWNISPTSLWSLERGFPDVCPLGPGAEAGIRV